MLGKSERQLRYLIKTGRLSAYKDGKIWRINSADLPDGGAAPGDRKFRNTPARAGVASRQRAKIRGRMGIACHGRASLR